MIAIQMIAVQFGFHSNIVGKASEMTQSGGDYHKDIVNWSLVLQCCTIINTFIYLFFFYL